MKKIRVSSMRMRGSRGRSIEVKNLLEAQVTSEPLEREIARMRDERMPVKGGATRVYNPEGEMPGMIYDFRVSRMDIARQEISTAMAAITAEDGQASVETTGEAESKAGTAQSE